MLPHGKKIKSENNTVQTLWQTNLFRYNGDPLSKNLFWNTCNIDFGKRFTPFNCTCMESMLKPHWKRNLHQNRQCDSQCNCSCMRSATFTGTPNFPTLIPSTLSTNHNNLQPNHWPCNSLACAHSLPMLSVWCWLVKCVILSVSVLSPSRHFPLGGREKKKKKNSNLEYMNAWFLCVCSGVRAWHRLQLYWVTLWHVDNGRTIDETGHCSVVELYC